MRQPQSANCAGVIMPLKRQMPMTSSARKKPSVAVVWIQLGVVAAPAWARRARRRRWPRRRTRRPAPGPAAGAGATISSARRPADRREGRQQADGERREAHHDDRDEERVLASDEVADAPEEQRAERADQEAGGIGRERRQQRGGVVALGEEQDREERREHRIEIEVVPLEDGAERGSEDDALFFAAKALPTRGLSRDLPPSPSGFLLESSITTRMLWSACILCRPFRGPAPWRGARDRR